MAFRFWVSFIIWFIFWMWGYSSCMAYLHANPKLTHDGDHPYQHLTRNDGLAGNIIYAIHQDHNGFIWFGTETGISRYDGREFTNFYVENGLHTNEIMDIYEDSKGRLWFLSLNKRPCFFDPNQGIIHNEQTDEAIASLPLAAKPIYEDAEGIVYFFSDAKGKFAGYPRTTSLLKQFNRLLPTKSYSAAVACWWEQTSFCLVCSNSIIQIDTLTNKISLNLVSPEALGYGYVGHLKGSKKTKYSLLYKDKITIYEKFKPLFSIDSIKYSHRLGLMINEISNQAYWVSSANGAHLVQNGNIITSVLHGIEIVKVREDYEGNTWFITRGNGVYLLKQPSKAIYTINSLGITSTANTKISSLSLVRSMGLKSDGTIRLGLANGCIQDYDFKNNKLSIPLKSGMDGRVLKIFQRSNKDWVGISDMCVFNPEIDKIYHPSLSNRISSKCIIEEPVENKLLIGGWLLLVLSPTNDSLASILKGRVYSLAWDTKSKKLWIGRENGLFSLDISYLTWSYIQKNAAKIINNIEYSLDLESKLDSLSAIKRIYPGLHAEIRSLCYDRNGNLWVSTLDQGVFKLNGKYSQHFTIDNGLPTNAIPSMQALYEDFEGNIWVATSRGIGRISPVISPNGRIADNNNWHAESKFNSWQGLLSDETFCVTRDKNLLYVGSSHGLNIIEIDKFQDDCASPPKLYFTKILVNDAIFEINKPLILPVDSNRIVFNFRGLSIKHQLQYHYYLVKNGNDTIDFGMTFKPELTYPQLRSGEYTLTVQAVSYTGCKSTLLVKPFTIKNYWYYTFWGMCFNGSLFLVFGGLGYFYYAQYKKKENRNKLKALHRKIDQLTQEARLAQIKPHFVSNALSAIKNKLSKGDLESAHKYILQFSELSRKVLDNSLELEISLKNEIQTLTLYIELQQLRYQNDAHQNTFDYEIHIASNINPETIRIPAMLLQPYIENAIEHGFRSGNEKIKNEPLSLKLYFGKNEDFLVCLIDDNGIGLSKALEHKKKNDAQKRHMGISVHESRGMFITEERIQSINSLYYQNSPFELKVETINKSDRDPNTTGLEVKLWIPIKNNSMIVLT